MEITNLAKDTEEFTGNVWKVENNGETLLIDVGKGEEVMEKIRDIDNLDYVILTHTHYDHVENLPKVLDQFSPEVYAFEPSNLDLKVNKVDEGQSLDILNNNVNFYHTPGHKDDSICIYFRKKGFLFTGDLIFPEGGFGRTDLEEGDRDTLISSIEKIKDLEVSSFYPGHDESVLEDANSWINRSLESARKREPKY